MSTTADNKLIDNGGLTDFTAATDEIAGVDYQYVKLVDGTADSTAKIPGDATNGLDVDVTRLPASTTYIGKVRLTDGTTDATVRDLAANDALNVAIVDGAGNQVTSFGGSGGTSSTDNSAFTPGTTADTPVAGLYQATPTTVTDGRSAAIGITTNREVKVSLTDSTLDVAHDASDTGNPVKIGGRAINAAPAAVANNDRTNATFDTIMGRQLTTHIDPGMQVWKSYNTTSQQTGAIVWAPAGGKRIAITHLSIGAYGTTAARLILYFGTAADTTYTAGTDQLVFAASFAPSTTAKPGAIPYTGAPIYAVTADHNLHITTDAALSVDLTVYGYEF